MSKYPPVRIVSPAQFDRATAQTPGSPRRAALAPNLGVKTALWADSLWSSRRARPLSTHHGEQKTIAYALKGECNVW
jgi:uncharacterized RmlC-like cupin family protein